MDWKNICSELDNVLVILALFIIAFTALTSGVDGKDIVISITSGLIGYLAKKTNTSTG